MSIAATVTSPRSTPRTSTRAKPTSFGSRSRASTATPSRRTRGWSDDDWTAAAERLADRGWLNDEGVVTSAGIEAHTAIEVDTDRMAEGPIRALGEDGLAELLGIMRPLATALAASGTIPYPNAIGVPAAEPE